MSSVKKKFCHFSSDINTGNLIHVTEQFIEVNCELNVHIQLHIFVYFLDILEIK